MEKKLTPPQGAALLAASRRAFIDFHSVMRVGANGKTLAALCKLGLLEKVSYPDGSNDWKITDAGRERVSQMRGIE